MPRAGASPAPLDVPSASTTSAFRDKLDKLAYTPSPEKRKAAAPSPAGVAKRVTRSGSRPIPAPSAAWASPKARAAARGGRKRGSGASRSGGARPSGGATVTNRLTDALAPDLLVMFVGVNPGLMTAETGYAYAHPSNRFWKLLHEGGLTERRHPPSDTHALVGLYGYGNTNVVVRPTRDASVLSRDEMDEGVAVVEQKVRQFRPEVVCLVGKGIWEAFDRVWRARGPRPKTPFRYGFVDDRIGATDDWEGAKLFAATTTSGLAAGMSWPDKLDVWTQLGQWVRERREQGVQGGWVEVDPPSQRTAQGDADEAG